ncbi:MAG: hypothetical protein EOQ39_22435 [Mesorhizobium sp.]|uniref:hypothetical protein n=1 Tax=Mesorhizobium sp. TaxID=1871066 RepID=UPI000FEA4391|nr:hypothetical protein [Mesorhizobium sp.]RWB05463.1 MAG: hypothetical protein EOQ37_14475 [Mesorhizobium sp.]RWB12566.1 MAG: hypothetical protein EOQ39_22435 [Mesorhizobium sp.]
MRLGERFPGRRKAVPVPAAAKAQPYTFGAPVAGWVTNQSLVKSKPFSAQTLENFLPTSTGIVMRGGSVKRATIGVVPVESFITYNAGGTKKIWACDATTIRDVTAPASPTVPPAASVSGQTSGYYSYVNFTTSGGSFVVAVNGTDFLQLYSSTFDWSAVNGLPTYRLNFDTQTINYVTGQTITGGTSGATATVVKSIDNGATGSLYIQSITGTFQDNETVTGSVAGSAKADIPAGVVQISAAITGVATSVLSHVWLYRNRLFFIEGGTMRARYLGVDSVTGALGSLNLSGIFQRGGSLLFGATWSLDAGDGIDDKCVFVTTEGEAAIFEGSNPAGATAAEWNLVGRYDLTDPMGRRATMRAGGDLIVATKEGLVPISAAINKDAAALSLAAISRNIEPDWKREAARRLSLPWEIIKWPDMNYAIVSLPVTADGQESWSFVVNLETGAWCKFVGWATRCIELHDSRLYFGTNDGKVFEAEIAGSDDALPIYYTYVGNPDHMKSLGGLKTVHQARPTFLSATPYNPKISFSVNYSVDLPSAPPAADGGTADLWDSGQWDVAKWDQAQPVASVGGGQWISIGKTGYVMQPQLQITGLLNQRPVTEFVQLDITFETGGVVV